MSQSMTSYRKRVSTYRKGFDGDALNRRVFCGFEFVFILFRVEFGEGLDRTSLLGGGGGGSGGVQGRSLRVERGNLGCFLQSERAERIEQELRE